MTKVCFSVTGEFMTEFSRTRVVEGRWDHAIQTLECLEGISLDQIIKILKGDSKLTGDSNVGIELEDDADQTYKEDLHHMFVGIWNNNGRFMRPYAYVSSWGPHDMVEGHSMGRRGSRWSHTSIYYADDPKRDLCLELKCDNLYFPETDILFREVSNFPHLIINAVSDPQKALDEYIEQGYPLDERGHLGGRSYFTQEDLQSIGGTMTIALDPATRDLQTEKFSDPPIKRVDSPLSGMLNKLKEADAQYDDFEKNKDQYIQRIIEQAGDNWLLLGEIDGEEIKVPQAPFENWCLWRGDGAHLALPWTPVCPPGLKMFGDDPYHTDFLLGGGFDLDDMKNHSSPLSQLAWDMRYKIQEEKLGFKCAVLCGTGKSSNLKVVHPKKGESCRPDEVAVIPNAGPNYVEAAMTAGAVITEQGGAMAHLVTVSREKDIKIVRVPKARKLYPIGMTLIVDCSKGDVHVPFDRIDYKMNFMGQIIDVDELE